jgi:hypothetical protein
MRKTAQASFPGWAMNATLADQGQRMDEAFVIL